MDVWSIPKGWPEKGESYEEAAIRELREETSLEIENLKGTMAFLGETYYRYKPKKLIAFYFNLTIENTSLLKCRGIITGTHIPEVDIIKWIDMDKALETIQKEQVVLLKKLIDKRFK